MTAALRPLADSLGLEGRHALGLHNRQAQRVGVARIARRTGELLQGRLLSWREHPVRQGDLRAHLQLREQQLPSKNPMQS